MSNGDKTIKNKNILTLARQLKKTGRLNVDDITEAEKMFNRMAPGEKKARFGEEEKKMSNGRGKLMNKKGSGIGAVAGSIPMTGGALGMAGSRVKQLLDELAKETEASKKNVMGIDKITGSLPGAGRAASKIVEGTTNLLKSKKQKRGGMNTDGVVDLTTEMVIDE